MSQNVENKMLYIYIKYHIILSGDISYKDRV
jgi:hypothetical protein